MIERSPLLLAMLGLTLGACGGDPCSRGAVTDRLAAASPGDTVTLGACEIEGPLTVPAGVTLAGRGAGRSTVVASGGGVAVRLEGGETATTLRGMTARSSGCAAVIAAGSGQARIEDVEIVADRGVGLAAEGLAALSVQRTVVSGPIDRGNADQPIAVPPYDCRDEAPATHGLIAVEVGRVELTGVDAGGFAAYGALFVRSDVQWTGGGVRETVGTGLAVWGGEASLDSVETCGALEGTAPIEAYNGVFADGAQVRSTELLVCDGDEFGLMHDDAVAVHTDLVARGNGFAGVWAQNGGSLELTGDGTLQGNGFAGLASFGTFELLVEGATVRDTAERVRITDGTGSVTAADGIHVVDGPATVRDSQALGNGRIGLLVDLAGGSTADVVVDGVRVDGSGEQLGAVAQNGSVEPGWDEGITREGATAANDAAVTEPLEIADAVGPNCLPTPEGLLEGGLADLGL